jgi:hypothetical protein
MNTLHKHSTFNSEPQAQRLIAIGREAGQKGIILSGLVYLDSWGSHEGTMAELYKAYLDSIPPKGSYKGNLYTWLAERGIVNDKEREKGFRERAQIMSQEKAKASGKESFLNRIGAHLLSLLSNKPKENLTKVIITKTDIDTMGAEAFLITELS